MPPFPDETLEQGLRICEARLTFTDPLYAVERFLACKARHLTLGPLKEMDGFFVRGAGQTGRRLSKHLLREGGPVISFIGIEPAKIDGTLRDRPIHPPEELERLVLEAGHRVVLAAVSSRGARARSRRHLESLSRTETVDFWCVASGYLEDGSSPGAFHPHARVTSFPAVLSRLQSGPELGGSMTPFRPWLRLTPFFATLLIIATAPATAGRWVVLIQGNPAGFMEIESPEPGELECHFEFNDRGRGPNLDTHIVLGADGLPREIVTTGNDYMKASVDESFRWSGGAVSWHSSQEQGERPLADPAFYLSRESACPEMGMLATALLGSPGQRLALLPEGEARLEIVGEWTFSAAGREKNLRHASLTGLGFSPTFLWLDENNSFFGTTSMWFSFLPEGWESIGEEMARIDDAANTDWTASLVGQLAHRPAHGVVFEKARVWDATRGEPISGQTVVVVGNTIQAIGPDGSVEVPEGVEVIDAGGRLLMPGLWDMHTHVGDLDGILNLAAGVTTVRDMANDIDKALALRLAWQEGTAIGPRLILSGFLDGPGPYAGPTKILVDTEEEAREAIDRYGDLGFEQIKIYSSVLPELVSYMAERAHHRGMRVSGHIPNGMTAEQAIRDGFDEIQHANMLFLNFWGDEGIDTRTPARFTEVAQRAADFDFEAPETLAFFDLLHDKAIVVDPTIAIFEGMFTARPGVVPATWKPIFHRLPPQVRRGMMGGGLEPPAGQEERYAQSYRAMVRMVGEVYRAGIPIVAGTDTLAGFGLHRELELYVEAGIPTVEVLSLATLGSAKVAGRAERLGTIEAGKLADFILVDGDPLTDISDIRKVTLTVKDGTIFHPDDMYRAVGVGQ